MSPTVSMIQNRVTADKEKGAALSVDILSGWSAIRKLGPNQRRPGIAPTLAARPREDSGFADHQALASRFHCRPRHFSKRVDFKNPLDLV